MMSFRVVNLLIPDEPPRMDIRTPCGPWTLERVSEYATSKAAITGANTRRPGMLPVAETYFLEHPSGPHAGAQASDLAFDELTPILLAATYATGMSVTIERSTPASEVLIAQPSAQWPRARALDRPSCVVGSQAEFQRLVEAFVQAWPTRAQTEKALLLVHHWLDALACWSMEDLYLSATTLLQVIVATEAAKQGRAKLNFLPGLTDAAQRMGLRALGSDVKDMRNELVHDGRLIGARFAGPDQRACAAVVADVMNWFDEYVHAALGMGPVARQRFHGVDFEALNAYSI